MKYILMMSGKKSDFEAIAELVDTTVGGVKAAHKSIPRLLSQ